MDEDREYPDWVEIYNPGDASINLDGYGLSDRPDNPYKWIFPVVTLEPEQYLIVYASGKDRVDSNNYHTNFKIDADGETLVLTDKAGVLCDSVTVKINETDISLGRKPDGNGAWMLFSEPTPGADNAADGFQGYTDAVVEMSMAGGFYNSGISVELSTDADNAEIRYTIDGSEPSKISMLYSSAVQIDSTTVVRARVAENGTLLGPILTRTYFIDESVTLPVISLSTDPDNLFDDDIGIYVEGNSNAVIPGTPIKGNFNEDWERPIHMEFYESNGSLDSISMLAFKSQD